MVAGFGAPLDDPDHARNAVDSALACQREVGEFGTTPTLPAGLRLHNRIGISTGRLLAGNVGSKRRLSYTLMGDDINLASRLEGVNKVYGTQTLVAATTREAYGEGMVFRDVDIVRVKGQDTPVRIFEPIGPETDVPAERREHLARFADALAAFRDLRFEALAEHDPVAVYYGERCREYQREPPPDDWDGVNTMLTK